MTAFACRHLQTAKITEGKRLKNYKVNKLEFYWFLFVNRNHSNWSWCFENV